ncbi:MAG: Superfamily helicase, family, partial [Verrucomicrobiales bacterium]|nr:Superfamily helicase, family [Verrucomicrobiales bacterium]
KLTNAFRPETVERGLDCYKTGCVRTVRAERKENSSSFCEIQLSASITCDFSYGVQATLLITPTGFEISSRCTCPMAWGCKHVVAAIYAAFDPAKVGLIPEGANTPQPTPRQPVPAKTEVPKSREIVLEPIIERWLAKLQKAAVVQNSTPRETRVHFCLKLVQRKVRVDAFVPKGKSLYHPVYLPNCVETPHDISEQDIALIRKLLLIQTGYGYDVWLQGSQSGTLLNELLATGHCYYNLPAKDSALSSGPERIATPKWIYDKKGLQRPAYEVTPPAPIILPLSPLYYVDESNKTCGPLRTDLPNSLAREWLDAPPLQPHQANAVAARILPLQSLGVPAPVKIEVEHLDKLIPVPHLRLYSFVALPYYGGYSKTHQRINAARLEFAYNEVRFHCAEPKTSHTIQTPEKLIHIIRNLDFENRCIGLLEKMGLETLSLIFSGYNLGRPDERHTKDDFSYEDTQDWFEFQTELDKLEKKGWKITFDPTFEFRLASAQDWYFDIASTTSANDWFSVDLGVHVEGEKLNLLPILVDLIQKDPGRFKQESLAADSGISAIPVPLPDGRSILFPLNRLRSIFGVLGELMGGQSLDEGGKLQIPKLRAAELSVTSDENHWRWIGSAELREFSNRLRNFEGIKPVAPPANFSASLRPYQQEGLNWLQFLREYDLGGVLADDMGLGKTIQTLAHLLIEKQSGRATTPSLVIAPTSVLTNWRREAERFAPELRVIVLHGLERKTQYAAAGAADLVITSYALLPRDREELLKIAFHYVILDEAQYIKNPKTTYAQTAGQLKAKHRLCLTGTPMENHLGELWSIFTFLLPGLLGNERQFNSHFRRPIEKFQDTERREILARRVKPFLLRRRKEDVLKELPPKTEIVQNVELEGSQRDLYESIRLAMHKRVKDEVDKKGISRAHIIILDALLKLRQVCCDPRLVKLPSAKKVTESAKLDLLMDLLPEMISEGRRILLFSQFTSMLALIEERLKQSKIEYVQLTGSTSDRETPVKEFQEGKVPLFLISLKAGGTGLNLTAADTVIHYDPWWNPAVENQATDRAHRIGQAKQVFVYKLITVGTVEEKIATLQVRKRELVEGLLSESGSKAGLKIELEDLETLFAPLK